MRKFAIVSVLSMVLLTPSWAMAANFNYNFIGLSGSCVRMKQKMTGTEFEIKGRDFGARLSMQPHENIYIELAGDLLKFDDSDKEGPFKGTVDGEQNTWFAGLGFVVPLGSRIDWRIVSGGIRIDRDITFTKEGLGQTFSQTDDKKATNGYFETGLKCGVSDFFNLDFSYHRTRKYNMYRIGGVTYLSKNLGLDLAYTYSPDTTDEDAELEMYTLELRIFF